MSTYNGTIAVGAFLIGMLFDSETSNTLTESDKSPPVKYTASSSCQCRCWRGCQPLSPEDIEKILQTHDVAYSFLKFPKEKDISYVNICSCDTYYYGSVAMTTVLENGFLTVSISGVLDPINPKTHDKICDVSYYDKGFSCALTVNITFNLTKQEVSFFESLAKKFTWNKADLNVWSSTNGTVKEGKKGKNKKM
jgi:hypothetical protein